MYYNNGDLRLEAYTDAYWANSLVDRRSTIGYCTLLRGNLITWKSKNQSIAAWSSVDTEF